MLSPALLLWLWPWLSGPLGEGAHEDGAKDEGGCLWAAVRSAAVQLSRDHSAHRHRQGVPAAAAKDG